MDLETAQRLVALAARNLNNGAAMASSAALCHEEAVAALELAAATRYGYDLPARAAREALASLKYSVGIFHPDFATAANLIGNAQ